MLTLAEKRGVGWLSDVTESWLNQSVAADAWGVQRRCNLYGVGFTTSDSTR